MMAWLLASNRNTTPREVSERPPFFVFFWGGGMLLLPSLVFAACNNNSTVHDGDVAGGDHMRWFTWQCAQHA